VLFICCVETAGVVFKNEQYRALQAGQRDLQQQGDRCENLTETAPIIRAPGWRIVISPLIAHDLTRSTSSWVSCSFIRS